MLLLAAVAGASQALAQSAEPVPRAVTAARTTTLPDCTSFVDAAASGDGAGTAEAPHKTIAAAVEAAESGAVICVAEGIYAEQIEPGEKAFTLAGGFQSGQGFKVRDSAAYITHAKGDGGSFFRIGDPGPKGDILSAIDGFEISGYSQAIVRDFYESQRFDITNNYIHDNVCAEQALVGAGFALNNVSGTIKGNVFANNACGRGGAGFLNDTTNQNTVTIESNLIDRNAGTEPDSAHGGALYLFGNTINVLGNEFVNNSVTKWGGGLFVGAYTPGNQVTNAKLAWNVYRGNRAGHSGGGFFCDDGASCASEHEVYYRNCGGNVLVDGGAGGSGPTVAKFHRVTNVEALDVSCEKPGIGVLVGNYEGLVADNFSFTNSIFWGNAPNGDFATACASGCGEIKVDVSSSMVQTRYDDGSIAIAFGAGNIAPADPMFVAPEQGDFRLQPASPAIGKGNPPGTDLGAYGVTDGATVAAPSEKPESLAKAAPPATAPPAPGVTPDEPQQQVAGAASQEGQAGGSNDPNDVPVKQAFDDAKELGTVAAWNAFLKVYPKGFYANLARAYLIKLEGPDPAPASSQENAAQAEVLQDSDAPKTIVTASGEATGKRAVPAIGRGRDFMGFPEKFNRYYTDPAWKPAKTLYVSPNGQGDGATRDAPASVTDAIAAARTGTQINFLQGEYTGCLEFTEANSGTYDQPVVLYGERKDDGSIGVTMTCCSEGRKTCLNLEGANYIAIDGFEFVGGNYGVRAVGLGYAASEHSRGVAVLGCNGHDQDRDPFFSGQSDWSVWERNVAYGAKEGDGHGIYLSNGSDWNIVRLNETYGNLSSDFQINADPTSTCAEVGVAFDDPRCDAYAGEGEGGQGASDYFLVDGNYFHHGLGPGANFTSVRRSVIRNNIFGPQARHNVSFWQETDNPKLGSSDNKILNNLFITTDKHALKFENHSTRNLVANNIFLGLKVGDGEVAANPSALLLEVDDTVGDNVYLSNLYVSGRLEGRQPSDKEIVLDDFSSAWFASIPTAREDDADGFTPTAQAPFLGLGEFSADAAFDREGNMRRGKVDLGPIELP